MRSNDAGKPPPGPGAVLHAGGLVDPGRIVVAPDHVHLCVLAGAAGFGNPANLTATRIAGRFPPPAKRADPAELARVIAALERKNDAMREELSQCRERVRALADTVADQTKRLAELQAQVAAGPGAASRGRGEALGDPDWTPPRSLLPRGMR